MKTAVFYYTQSGQALHVAKSICEPLETEVSAEKENCVIYKEIVPLQKYPFPWNKKEFFDTFPETYLELPPSDIASIDFSDIQDADLIMIVGQSWFLSPSLPIQSFLANKTVREYLNGRNIIFVNACRNMWLMTSRKIRRQLEDIHAHLIGHIVLQDKAPNLVSVLTIVRWLLYGKKEAAWLLPQAGISQKELKNVSRFGKVIRQSWYQDHFSHLQEDLLAAGAIIYKPSIIFMEKAGHRMFHFWANYIRQKGAFRNPRRYFRTNLFFIYLLTVLFLVSPFSQLFFYLTYPLHPINRQKHKDCNLDNKHKNIHI